MGMGGAAEGQQRPWTMKRPCDLPEANQWWWLTPPTDAPLRRGWRWKQPKGTLTSQRGPCNPTLVRPQLHGYKGDPQHMCLRSLRYPEIEKKRGTRSAAGWRKINRLAGRVPSDSRWKMCFCCGWFWPPTHGSKVKSVTSVLLSYLCLPSFLQRCQDPQVQLSPERKKWHDESFNSRWAEPLICHSAQKQIFFFPFGFDKCRIYLRLPDLSFLTFPLVLSSCYAPALAWINNLGPNCSDPPQLQSEAGRLSSAQNR